MVKEHIWLKEAMVVLIKKIHGAIQKINEDCKLDRVAQYLILTMKIQMILFTKNLKMKISKLNFNFTASTLKVELLLVKLF